MMKYSVLKKVTYLDRETRATIDAVLSGRRRYMLLEWCRKKGFFLGAERSQHRQYVLKLCRVARKFERWSENELAKQISASVRRKITKGMPKAQRRIIAKLLRKS